jgi:hypothetical protein
MATTIELTAGQVMDRAASIMNNPSKSVYPYSVQLPYLNMALQDLQEFYEQNEIPVVATGSAAIPVPAGTDHLAFADSGTTRLPDDLIEPSVLWERQAGINPYTIMTRVDFLDQALAGQEINQFIWYVWEENQIKFFAANQDNEIKMNYIRNLFVTVDDPTDIIAITNGIGYLANRTARHLCYFIAENPTRGDVLNNDAIGSLDRLLSIGTKGRQQIITRRRPFRAGYKRGTFI